MQLFTFPTKRKFFFNRNESYTSVLRNASVVSAVFICAMFFSKGANAQTWSGSTSNTGDTYRHGYVGILKSVPDVPLHIGVNGTGTYPLEAFRADGRIRSNIVNGGMWLSNSDDGFVGNNKNTTTGVDNIGFYTNGVGWNAFQVKKSNGFIGIGTETPNTNLSFGSGLKNNKIALYETSTGGDKMGFGVQSNQFRIHLSNSSSRFTFLDAEGGNALMTLRGSGRLSLGVDSTPTGYKFAVNGKMIAEELKVSLKNDWPDYVFKSGYTLKSLEDLETYLNANGHLPNIPSAEEVKQDGGIELGAMNAKLLEKIEELTLYIIEERKARLELEKLITQLGNTHK